MEEKGNLLEHINEIILVDLNETFDLDKLGFLPNLTFHDDISASCKSFAI